MATEERTKITLMNEIDGFSFTGVLENSLEMTVDKTSYPIEIGAQATDNAIVKNIRYSLKGRGVERINWVVCG